MDLFMGWLKKSLRGCSQINEIPMPMFAKVMGQLDKTIKTKKEATAG